MCLFPSRKLTKSKSAHLVAQNRTSLTFPHPQLAFDNDPKVTNLNQTITSHWDVKVGLMRWKIENSNFHFDSLYDWFFPHVAIRPKSLKREIQRVLSRDFWSNGSSAPKTAKTQDQNFWPRWCKRELRFGFVFSRSWVRCSSGAAG